MNRAQGKTRRMETYLKDGSGWLNLPLWFFISLSEEKFVHLVLSPFFLVPMYLNIRCYDCQGFGLVKCPSCGKKGLTPEQRGER